MYSHLSLKFLFTPNIFQQNIFYNLDFQRFVCAMKWQLTILIYDIVIRDSENTKTEKENEIELCDHTKWLRKKLMTFCLRYDDSFPIKICMANDQRMNVFGKFFSQPKMDWRIYFTIIIVYNTAWAYLIFYLRFFLKFFGWFHSYTHTNLLSFVDELKRNIVSKRSITNNETTTKK